MVLRFLARLCASDFETVVIPTEDRVNGRNLLRGVGEGSTCLPAANAVVISDVQRRLSGLSGSTLQRIAGMLEALRLADPAGATHAVLYAVPEGEYEVAQAAFVQIGSAQSLNDILLGHGAATLSLLPDAQQQAFFRIMVDQQAPVFDCIDRSSAMPSITSSTSFLTTSHPQLPLSLAVKDQAIKRNSTTAAGQASAILPSSSSSPLIPQCPVWVAAIPILQGNVLVGALWLEQQDPSATTTTTTHNNPARTAHMRSKNTNPAKPVRSAPPQRPPLLADPHALHALGFACSMCLLGPDPDHLGWLAGALARLGGATTMATLIDQLCACLATHVRRRFVLEGHVIAALVPPPPSGGGAADSAPPLALLLQPVNTTMSQGGAACAGAGKAAAGAQALEGAPHGDALGAGGDGLTAARGRCGGSSRVQLCASPRQGLSMSQYVVQRQSQQQQQGSQCEQLGASHGSMRKLRAAAGGQWANGMVGGMVRDQQPTDGNPQQQPSPQPYGHRRRLSLDFQQPPCRGGPATAAATTTGMATHADLIPRTGHTDLVPRTPSLNPTASCRSIVIPLYPPEGLTPTAAAAAAAATAGGAAGATTLLHAKAFPLQLTVLQTCLQLLQQGQEQQQPQPQQQQHSRAPQGQPRSGRPAGGAAGAVGRSQTPGSAGGASTPACGNASGSGSGASNRLAAAAAVAFSAAAVIEDVQSHVQNVHKPSADVCMLLGLRQATAPGAVSAGTPGIGGQASSSSSAGGGGTSGSVPGSAAAMPQSMVVLVAQLAGGAALGLYLCFPRRLPGPLLEAVRASCQELLDEALAPLLRSRLVDGAIAPEYETLCCASPGSYAVLHSTMPSCASTPHPLMPGAHPGGLSSVVLPASCLLTDATGELAAALAGAGVGDSEVAAAVTTTTRDASAATARGVGRASAGVMPRAGATAQATAAVGGANGANAAAAGGGMPPEFASDVLSTGDMDVLLTWQQLQGQGQAAAGVQQGQQEQGGGAAAKRTAAADIPARGTSASPSAGVLSLSPPHTRKHSTSAVARLAKSLGLAGRSTSTAEQRCASRTTPHALTAAVAAAAAATSPVHIGGGEGAEPFSLNQMLLTSSPADLMASLGLGLGASAGGAGGVLAAPVVSGGCTRSFRCVADLEQAGLAAASVITVAGADVGAAMMRQQLDLLVTSVTATIGMDTAQGGVSCAPLDDLDALELCDVLGQGGGGTVLRGRLGALDVAVKLMELRSPDTARAKTPQQPEQPRNTAAPPAAAAAAATAAAGGTTGPAADTAALDRLCLNARREMLRNATELAVQSRVSHPNVVQIYATYNDVVLLPKRGPPGSPGSSYRLSPAAWVAGARGARGADAADEEGADSRHQQVACVAAIFELCDLGSLGGALAARTFPRPPQSPVGGQRGAQVQRSSWGLQVDMKGVYMTLLDVALALRHLHSLHLVHRDLKPANLLLKSSPRDHRGFTVKLADFGFVLHLAETAEDGTRYTVADQACGTVTHMAPEALVGRAKIDSAVDVYAFGILMWEMFSGGVRPFPRLQPDRIPRAVYRGARPTFADDIPFTFRNLATACWASDPKRRPTAADLVCLLNSLLQGLEAQG